MSDLMPGSRFASRILVPLGLLLIALCAPSIQAESEDSPGETLRVLGSNVWHGLRTEGKSKFPGEDDEHRERRIVYQIEQIKKLDPDLLVFQEVNPNSRLSKRYANELGYTEIHKVTSCGIHIPPIKIPKNMNEGLTILARPELELKRVGKKRLSGGGSCSASYGWQTNETRWALFGEITFGKRKILVVNTHLHSSPFVLPGFEENLNLLVEDGILLEEQRDEIVERLEKRRARTIGEAIKLVEEIDQQYRLKRAYPHIILVGDLNSTPESDVFGIVTEAGFLNAARQTDPQAEFLTFDPVVNELNYEIGVRKAPPLPTFESAEVEKLLAARGTVPRKIDHIFIKGRLEFVDTEMVLNRPRGELYPSDHFGVLATVKFMPGSKQNKP